jgi:hypothetical protein
MDATSRRTQRPSHRRVAGAASAGAAIICACALLAAAAAAATHSGSDRGHGARFSLTGRTLTVTLSRTSNVRGIAGQKVRATCVSQRRAGDGPARTLRWPSSRRTLKVHFAASAGAAPLFCSVDSASLRGRTFHLEAVLR